MIPERKAVAIELDAEESRVMRAYEGWPVATKPTTGDIARVSGLRIQDADACIKAIVQKGLIDGRRPTGRAWTEKTRGSAMPATFDSMPPAKSALVAIAGGIVDSDDDEPMPLAEVAETAREASESLASVMTMADAMSSPIGCVTVPPPAIFDAIWDALGGPKAPVVDPEFDALVEAAQRARDAEDEPTVNPRAAFDPNEDDLEYLAACADADLQNDILLGSPLAASICELRAARRRIADSIVRVTATARADLAKIDAALTALGVQ